MREIELLKKPLFWLVLGLVLIWVAIFQLPDGRLHLIFCDVGQGDAILISYRSTQVLIDGGPDKRVLGCLAKKLPFWDRTIEMVVLTHPQADHFMGLIDVIERYEVKQFVINSIIDNSPSFLAFHQVVLEEKAGVYSPKAGERIKIGPLQFLVLWPKKRLGDEKAWLEILEAATYPGNLNETSIVLLLSFGNFDVLLTGDISTRIEKEIMGEFCTGPIEVLKVAHHGSRYSTSQEFLRSLRPNLAVVSVGKNRFGHPAKEVIERLSSQAVRLLRTDKEGEVEIVSDGKRWGIVR